MYIFLKKSYPEWSIKRFTSQKGHLGRDWGFFHLDTKIPPVLGIPRGRDFPEIHTIRNTHSAFSRTLLHVNQDTCNTSLLPTEQLEILWSRYRYVSLFIACFVSSSVLFSKHFGNFGEQSENIGEQLGDMWEIFAHHSKNILGHW